MKKILLCILNIVLTSIITLCICLLCISFSIKKVIVNTISKNVVAKEVTKQITQNIESIYSDVDADTLEKIKVSVLNSQSINNITQKYFDEIVDYVLNDKSILSLDVKEEIIELADENEDILKDNDIEITQEQKKEFIDKILYDNKINEAYKAFAENIKKDITKKDITIIKTYNEVISNKFRFILLGIIFVMTFLIALIKKSYYRWIFNISLSFVLSGLILSFIVPFIINVLSNNISNKFTLNADLLVNTGYLCFVIFALLVIIYLAINKILVHNNSKYEY